MSLYHLLQRLKGVFIYMMYNILTTENSNGNDAKIRSFFCVLEDKMQIWGLGRCFTTSSKGKKCPSSDSKSCSKGRYF